ncbi:MAG: LLM class F420-dependent oxidoreductase [Armatimonadota bacterium]|nr:LLM class F420-dependent oxidoreductase [Armatimonadota bacterium]
MRFSVALPTCVEGLVYPVPYITPRTLMEVGLAAERLGYHSVWGNDHLHTQNYVRDEWKTAPNYYEPLVSLAALAARTSRIRLGTSVIVMPMREPVLLAKQAATLDQLSGGRLMLGIGVGAYREEFEAVRPDAPRGTNRGAMAEEGIQALRALFAQEVASFQGRYYHFRGVMMGPKPVQNPLPIYSGGNSDAGAVRAGRYSEGWLPAVLPIPVLQRKIRILREAAQAAGRDPSAMDIAPQMAVCMGRTREEALRRFRDSQVYRHLLSLKRSTLRDLDLEQIESMNFIGTPAQVAEQIAAYGAAGVTHCSALIFPARTIEETLDQMAWFASDVMNQFAAET